MKIKPISLVNVILMTICLTLLLFISATAQTAPYDPWCDSDDDWDIDIFDIVDIAGRYGSSGEPFLAKAAVEYDSGWLNISNQAGKSFNISHGLNSSDIIVDINGKTTPNDGVHQRHLGGIGFELRLGRTYGGINHDSAYSVVQTIDGGYAMAGSTFSYGAGDRDAWLVKTDSTGNIQWNQTYGGTDRESWVSVVGTSDGGYLLAGDTASFGAGERDFYLVKTDSTGDLLWIRDSFKFGLAWTDSTDDTIELYRGVDDRYWNYVRVQIWRIRETP